jgi:hypothetical protein
MEYKIIFSSFNNTSILVDTYMIQHSQKLTELFSVNKEIILPDINPEIFSHIYAYINNRKSDNTDSFALTLIKNMPFNVFVDVVLTCEFLHIDSFNDIISKYFKNLLHNNPEFILSTYIDNTDDFE